MPRHLQVYFGMVEDNGGNNSLHMQRISMGMTIHIPQGMHRGPA